jgi:hypothetical protein
VDREQRRGEQRRAAPDEQVADQAEQRHGQDAEERERQAQPAFAAERQHAAVEQEAQTDEAQRMEAALAREERVAFAQRLGRRLPGRGFVGRQRPLLELLHAQHRGDGRDREQPQEVGPRPLVAEPRPRAAFAQRLRHRHEGVSRCRGGFDHHASMATAACDTIVSVGRRRHGRG